MRGMLSYVHTSWLTLFVLEGGGGILSHATQTIWEKYMCYDFYQFVGENSDMAQNAPPPNTIKDYFTPIW